MPRLTVRGADLAYDVSGAGPAVVQLHGLTSSRARDAGFGLDLAGGMPGVRTLRYDARGHGRSTGTADAADYTWPRLADDLLAVTDHVFGDEPVHGVGPSMGTGTLLHAAVRRPERFSTLTLLIPPTAWNSRIVQKMTYRQSADLVERSGVDAFVELGLRAARPPAVDATAPVGRPDVDEDLLPTVFRGAATTDLPPYEEIAELAIPTMILCWVEDPSHPMSTAWLLHEILPDSRMEVATTPDQVAHWPALLADHVGQSSAGSAA